MNPVIDIALEYIQSHKDRIEKASAIQKLVWEGLQPATHPLLLSCEALPQLPRLSRTSGGTYDASIPAYDPKTIHYDSEKMLISELGGAARSAAGGMQAVPSVRANMGCGIFPTLFGIEQDLFEDKMPWVQRHLSKEAILKMGPEDLAFSDEFKAGLEHMDYMAEILDGSCCGIYPMDLQGPFDTAHLVYGDKIFYDLYDDPAFIHHLLELSCQAIFFGMDECLRHTPGSDDNLCHYNNLVMPCTKGGIKISEDTSTLLSKAHIQEYVTPYTNRVLERYGGGYIHYCGKNEHLYKEVMGMPLAYGINFGNPEKHEMAGVLKDCSGRGKIYYGAIPERSDEKTEEYFKRCVTNAYANGRIHLMLMYTYGVGKGETPDEVAGAWDDACQSVLSGNIAGD